MAIEPGADFIDFTGHDPREAEYTGDYEFDVILALKSDCIESEVITKRNTFMQKVVADSNTNSYRPFKLTRLQAFQRRLAGAGMLACINDIHTPYV